MSEDPAFTPSSFGPGVIRPAELAAYLAAPAMFEEALVGGGPDFAGYAWLADVVRSPRYATAVGLLMDGHEHYMRAELARAQGKGLGNVGEKMKQWFKANF